MTSQPLLSIAIPTYNFGAFLPETLASVLPNLPSEVEVVVVDGASTDNTPDVVADFQKEFPELRYVHLSSRGGIDQDMARAVAEARGRWCWLLSADDLIFPGAVSTVLSHLAQEPDIVLLSHSNCDARMREIRARHPVLQGGTRLWQVRDRKTRRRYFSSALTTEALFSFISGLVVRRRTWDVTRSTDDLFHGSCWSHAARLLLEMRDRGLDILHVASPLVARRGENDSFADRGIVARYSLAIDGYSEIVAQLFGRDSFEYRQTQRVLRREFSLYMFMNAKHAVAHRPGAEDGKKLAGLFDQLYPRSLRFAPRRIVFRSPAAMFLSLFEVANSVRHKIIGRTT